MLVAVLGADRASGDHIVAGPARSANSNPANANNGAGGKRGGILQEVTDEDISHLDPGLAYFVLDYQFTYATQRPLYSYCPTTRRRRSLTWPPASRRSRLMTRRSPSISGRASTTARRSTAR
jgi:hypothetical protein